VARSKEQRELEGRKLVIAVGVAKFAVMPVFISLARAVNEVVYNALFVHMNEGK
jgi:hypothetical protein